MLANTLLFLVSFLVKSINCTCFLSFIDVPEFTRTPTSVNATLGSKATFNCNVVSGVVIWIVNGSQLSELNASDISAHQFRNKFWLNIPAIVKYNNTMVVCAVTIFGGSDNYSDPVILRIQGISYT